MDDQAELRLQTERFVQSEYGQYILDLLEEMYQGKLSNAQSINNEKPVRDLDRAVGIREVIIAIKSPLE
jgi:hypothetical protein